MAKGKQYRVARTERIVQGDTVYNLEAGSVTSDVPDELAEILVADGTLVEVDSDKAKDIEEANAEQVKALEERAALVADEAEERGFPVPAARTTEAPAVPAPESSVTKETAPKESK